MVIKPCTSTREQLLAASINPAASSGEQPDFEPSPEMLT